MKISEKRKTRLYAAIHEVIMKLRIELKLPDNQDFKLAQLANKVYDDVCTVLNIKR